MKKRNCYALMCILICAACSHQTAIPLGNDLAEIDVSGGHGRAGAMELATKKAAETTIAYGYDKFIVVSTEGWSVAVGSAVATKTVGVAGSRNNPESKIVIHMYHAGEAGSEKAIDARAFLDNPNL